MSLADVETDVKESVHLQLNALSTQTSPGVDEETADTSNTSQNNGASTSASNNNKSSIITVHSFTCPAGKRWKSLNTTKRKFVAFLAYNNIHAKLSEIETVQFVTHSQNHSLSVLIEPRINSQHSNNDNKEPCIIKDSPEASMQLMQSVRDKWRRLWKQGQLLTDRTELLAVFPSEQQQKAITSQASSSTSTTTTTPPRRGGFNDLLSLYTDRMVGILQDEQEQIQSLQEQQQQQQSADHSSPPSSLIRMPIVTWLEENYGVLETWQLMNHRNIRHDYNSQQLMLKRWKLFLEWFRSEFPYYYDKCDACGASMKEELAKGNNNHDHQNNPQQHDHTDDDHPQEQEDYQNTFVGYIYPSTTELAGKASRTELYNCHVCNSMTRFPRYNSAAHVIEHKRGRCGEYSMLLFRILRALNYKCRWVVDWADHVWAEVALEMDHADYDGIASSTTPTTSSSSIQWIHLDPCEAAVDEKLLYQGWGKKQTYILAFYAPPLQQQPSSWESLTSSTLSSATYSPIPLIEDVTQSYTSDSLETIHGRREESCEQVEASVAKATIDLQSKLSKYYKSY